MRFYVLAVVFLLFIETQAAYIEWGGVQQGGFCYVEDSYFVHGAGLVCKDATGWWLFQATVGIQVEALAGDYYRLSFYNEGNYVSQNWLLSEKGGIVHHGTTTELADEQYLVAYGIDDYRHIGPTEVIVQPDTIMFLAFICKEDGLTPTNFIYGWVELGIDSDGNVIAIDSAYNLDGGPMVVGGGAWEGGIPEPSGGVLFLLGAAALGLRRVKKLKSRQ